MPEVVALTAAINLPSRRVMERLGMTRRTVDDFAHPNVPEGDPLRPHVLYRLARRGGAGAVAGRGGYLSGVTTTLHSDALAEAMPQIVWTASPDGRIEDVTRCWAEETGRPVDSALGAGRLDALHPADRPRSRAAWELTLCRERGSGERDGPQDPAVAEALGRRADVAIENLAEVRLAERGATGGGSERR